MLFLGGRLEALEAWALELDMAEGEGVVLACIKEADMEPLVELGLEDCGAAGTVAKGTGCWISVAIVKS